MDRVYAAYVALHHMQRLVSQVTQNGPYPHGVGIGWPFMRTVKTSQPCLSNQGFGFCRQQDSTLPLVMHESCMKEKTDVKAESTDTCTVIKHGLVP